MHLYSVFTQWRQRWALSMRAACLASSTALAQRFGASSAPLTTWETSLTLPSELHCRECKLQPHPVCTLAILWTCVRSCQPATFSSMHVNILSRYMPGAAVLCSHKPQHLASAGLTVSTMGIRARRWTPPRWLMLLLHVPVLQGALFSSARCETTTV